MILITLLTLFSSQAISADYSPPEVRKVVTDQHGYQQAWVKVKNPSPGEDSSELPLELSVPFCNAKSVRKLDETCAMPNGRLMKVTEIIGKKIKVEPIDVSTGKSFEIFASHIRMSGSSRMPASAPYHEVICEASCPQMDFTNTCQGAGVTQEKAYKELEKTIQEKADTDCKLCNLRAAVCDGVLYQKPPLQDGRP